MLLSPMSEEKDVLLTKAAKEWNRMLWIGSRRARWAEGLWRFRRQRQAALQKANYTIYYKLARDGVSRGLSGRWSYTSGGRSFFVPRSVMTLEDGILWLRLFPDDELGFAWPGPDVPVLARVFKSRGQWHIDPLYNTT
jgi:hypothetical protein